MTETSELSALVLRWQDCRGQGRDVMAEDLCADRPELLSALQERIKGIEAMGWLDESVGTAKRSHGDATEEGRLSLCLGAEPAPGYRLVHRLGRGGFGEVWAAQTSGRLVAVKVIHLAPDPERPCRKAEAELEGLVRIQNVSHPHVLQIVGVEVKGASVLLITELADGTLGQHFRTLPPTLGRSHRTALAVHYLRGVAEALDHLRVNYRLMHLDVKPANLLLVDGMCKLADFGTVKAMRADRGAPAEVVLSSGAGDLSRTTIRYRSCQELPLQEAMHPEATLYTRVGAFTLYYAAPEVFEGRASYDSDQYSLALTFCELAADGIPFGGQAEEQFTQRSAGEMDLSLLPPVLRPVVARALSPRSNDRFPSCVAFIEALECCLPSPKALGLLPADGNSGLWPRAPMVSEEHRPIVIEEASPEDRPKRRLMAIGRAVVRVLFFPIRFADVALRIGAWLAGRSDHTTPHRKARQGEYWMIFVLALGLACVPAVIQRAWWQRLGTLVNVLSSGVKTEAKPPAPPIPNPWPVE